MPNQETAARRIGRVTAAGKCVKGKSKSLVSACYHFAMRIIEAHYENGLLRPKAPLSLRRGERVGVIVVRWPDPARWDLKRIAAAANSEDVSLAETGLDEWAQQIDGESKG